MSEKVSDCVAAVSDGPATEEAYEAHVSRFARELYLADLTLRPDELLAVAKAGVDLWPDGVHFPDGHLLWTPQGKIRSFNRRAFSFGEVEASWQALSTRRGRRREEWRGRSAGFAETLRIDVKVRGDDPLGFAEGHIIRWLLDKDVLVGSARMNVAMNYATGVVFSMETPNGPRGFEHGMADHHCAAVAEVSRLTGVIGLAEELLLLSWLLDQSEQDIDLEVFLNHRTRWVLEHR